MTVSVKKLKKLFKNVLTIDSTSITNPILTSSSSATSISGLNTTGKVLLGQGSVGGSAANISSITVGAGLCGGGGGGAAGPSGSLSLNGNVTLHGGAGIVSGRYHSGNGNPGRHYSNSSPFEDGKTSMISCKFGLMSKYQVDLLRLLCDDKPDAIVVIAQNSADLNAAPTIGYYNSTSESAVEKYELQKKLNNSGIDTIDIFARQFVREKLETIAGGGVVTGVNTGNQSISGSYPSVVVSANGTVTSHSFTSPPGPIPIGTTWFDSVTHQLYVMTANGLAIVSGITPPNPAPIPVPITFTTSKTYLYDIVLVEDHNDLTLMSIVGFVKIEEHMKLSQFIKELDESLSNNVRFN